MINDRWQVRFTRRELPDGTRFGEWLGDRDGWLDEADLVDGTPYLLSPMFEFDVSLNAFFSSPEMAGRPWNTLAAYARDMAAFFTFLWVARGRLNWSDADEADHLAYKAWRNDELRRAGSTWGREVSTVNGFYTWARDKGLVPVNPIPQRAARPRPRGARGRTAAGTTPATAPHHARREKIQWLPPKSYRTWRDVGLRGYGLDGLPEPGFRGRSAARNAVFADLMVRTGMRLSEQASLSVFELPARSAPGNVGYQRFWLPEAIAKWGSARWVYVPLALVKELAAYRDYDRPEAVQNGRDLGVYKRVRRPLVLEDPGRPEVSVPGRGGIRQRVRLEDLTVAERRAVLIDTSEGLEPAAFWLTEDGEPMAASSWQDIFVKANARCAQRGLELRCNPHMLRHSFAVVALEQLQRGHLRELSGMSPAQRTHYTQVFGDPLDWVRRRLGHASIVTTQVYLHCLAELEMETRLALVPDWWADPRDLPVHEIGDAFNGDWEPADEDAAGEGPAEHRVVDVAR